MVKRDNVSEAILWTMAPLTSLLLMVMPGSLFWFFLGRAGYPLAALVLLLLWGIPGPALMFWLDRDLYGPRDTDRSAKRRNTEEWSGPKGESRGRRHRP